MKLNPHIFREYDIRGNVDTDLSEDFAYLLGRAYACLARENNLNNIAIGFDCRLSSNAYAQALARGISAEGLDCCITGMGPTPQLYFAIFSEGFGGGIQVTGSHNPPEMNGFKIMLGQHTLLGPEIQNLKERMQKLISSTPAGKSQGKINEMDLRPKYIQALIKNSSGHIGKRRLKVVVDAGNGVGGLVGPEVLRQLGVEVIELYCEPDGRFPNHHPDPTEHKNIVDLINNVKQSKADFGIGWDGDADRIGVIDERGEMIFGDMLVLIFAREILKSNPGAAIIGDVKCSGRLFDDVKRRGGKPIMWKTGHSLIKQKLKEVNGALGGEMSGHIAFKHRYYGFDDALYSSSRFVEIMSHFDGPVSSLLADLPPAIVTPEIRIDCPENIKFKVAQRAQQAFKEYQVETIDGVRVNFEHGWALVRASNTQPILVMRFEANTAENLEKYQKLVRERITQIQHELGA